MKTFLFLVCILVIVLGSQNVVSDPNTPLTEDSFCNNPLQFSGGLVIPDPKSSAKDKRYLFRSVWMYPYIREDDRQEIDWKNVKLIGDVFPEFKGSSRVRTAFYNNERKEAYLMSANINNDSFFVYTVDQSSGEPTFTFAKQCPKFDVPNEYIYWIIDTIQLDGSTITSQMHFIDMTALSGHLGRNPEYGSIEYGKHKNKFIFEYNYATNKQNPITERIRLFNETFPNTIVLTNNLYQFVRIPIQFDGYYQTMNKETVFFKDTYACVLLSDTIDKFTETPYCQSWVDTRTIVGCTVDTFTQLKTGPEVNPNEPKEDIASDI